MRMRYAGDHNFGAPRESLDKVAALITGKLLGLAKRPPLRRPLVVMNFALQVILLVFSIRSSGGQ